MVIGGRRQSEQHLQNTMHVRRREQIEPANNVRDTLAGIVDDDSEMVACRNVLAHDDNVTPALRPRGNTAGRVTVGSKLHERQRPASGRLSH